MKKSTTSEEDVVIKEEKATNSSIIKPTKLNRIKSTLNQARKSTLVNYIVTFLVPLVISILVEWIWRGSMGGQNAKDGLFSSFVSHMPSYILSYLLLLAIYVFVSQLLRQHWVGTLITGICGMLPAIITHYKITLRNEPFLPWDLNQVGDLIAVKGELEFDISYQIVISGISLLLLVAVTAFIKMPDSWFGRKHKIRTSYAVSLLALVSGFVLVFGVYLNPTATKFLHIEPYMWKQSLFYKKHGVITSFLTNVQTVNIQEPDGYNKATIDDLTQEVQQNKEIQKPFYTSSFSGTGQTLQQQPDIIYVMGESIWDVTQLEGIEYDQAIMPNIEQLKKEAAYGYVYSPSFGGGTCDVEFEALTGFSMAHLPAGSKPYQQYITPDTFSLPQYLKQDSYKTMAIHSYGARFWNRDVAYPRLGIDEFISSEDFENPTIKRNLISDESLVDRVIEEYEANKHSDSPIFIHAVTMQNHTTYDPKKYPAEELVRVTKAPEGLSQSTIGQLEDCATGVREFDTALGELTDYLRTVERPTIVVFWGDHLNPMSDGYKLFEETGFIDKEDHQNPKLFQTPLLMWSNFSQEQVDLGVVGAYNISPVMLDLYGLQKPPYFEYLMQNYGTMSACNRGYVFEPNSEYTEDMTPEQQHFFDEQALLQYDQLFGKRLFNTNEE